MIKCNGRLAKERKRAKGVRARDLQHKIRLVEIQLQRDPEDESVRSILSVAQGHLTDSLQKQVAQNHQLSAATWFRYGDTCSKHFFDFHRIGRKRTLLKELTTEDGEITGQEDLGHYVRSFYTHFYTSKVNALGTSEAQEDCWASTPTRVSNEMNNELIRAHSERGPGCHRQCQRTKHQDAMASRLSSFRNSWMKFLQPYFKRSEQCSGMVKHQSWSTKGL